MPARSLTRIGAAFLVAVAMVANWPKVASAALSPFAAEFMIRDCIARFGDARVRVCEAVAESGTRRGVNPTTGTCLAATDRRGIEREIARRICGYYFQNK